MEEAVRLVHSTVLAALVALAPALVTLDKAAAAGLGPGVPPVSEAETIPVAVAAVLALRGVMVQSAAAAAAAERPQQAVL
jgi:hypothetical protein